MGLSGRKKYIAIMLGKMASVLTPMGENCMYYWKDFVCNHDAQEYFKIFFSPYRRLGSSQR